jgi:uncharacterized protein
MSDSANLIQAIKAGDLHGVRNLLHANPAAASATDENGVSALTHSIYTMRPDITEALLENGAVPGFFEAAALDRTDRLGELLQHSPELLNAYSKDGFPPVALACFFGAVRAAEFLLAKGADPNLAARNQMKVTAMHAAVATRDVANAERLVRLLLEHGAQPNVKQDASLTPLHHAAAKGHTELARVLVEHGADPESPADDGKTPLDLARENGHAEVVELLSAASKRK